MTGNDGAGPSTHPGLRSNPIHTSIQMSDPCIPNYTETRYQPDYHDWGDAQHVMYENMDEAYDDTLYGRPSPTGEIRSPYDEDDDDDVRPCGSPYEDAFTNLMKEDITKWTIAHDGGKRWGIITTNDVESFNGLMKGARSVPISACVQLTFYRLVKFFADQAAEARQMQTEGLHFPRDVQEKLDLYQSRGMTHQVIPYDWDNLVFEVTTKFHNNAGTNRQTVKLNIPTCTCGKLEIFKIPCSHIFAAAARVETTWLPFVASEYKMEVYMRVWDTKFEPIKHPNYWPEYKGRTLLPLSTRLRPPKRGRPESTRIRNEMDVSRQRATKHCTNCKQPGHDRRTCPQRARIVQD
ncbi:hypothetical protein L1049_023764 [Liquidambar formosana]|uniref:SWIM-type domain-containing protein n=1 Tax=Liquidambar formosana TaxID=63359 RepID=A0AAP0X3T3_LIQFO